MAHQATMKRCSMDKMGCWSEPTPTAKGSERSFMMKRYRLSRISARACSVSTTSRGPRAPMKSS